MTKITALTIFASFIAATSMAAPKGAATQDLLVKFAPNSEVLMQSLVSSLGTDQGSKAEIVSNNWVHLTLSPQRAAQTLEALNNEPSVEYVQPNYKIHLLEDYKVTDPLRRAALLKGLARQGFHAEATKPDNLPIPSAPTAEVKGTDPLLKNQWGMNDIGVQAAWNFTLGSPNMIVAVIDTGVDYTHEDLLPNLWRNSKEIPDNGLDDDHNGYIDDVIGWDFAENDNKPYDLAVDPIELLTKGGNPGHGTHCAGNVAARGGNSIGISGVAPNVKIMSLRFIGNSGEGTTADAIKAVKYAVDNGAKVLSNSWGSEGEDPADATNNKALRDVITYAQEHGVLFIAAAGNGHQGVGYNNDTDSAPGVPASYDNENIISVAAIDVNNELGAFSNWGAKTVDIAAPGVNVFSTMVGGKYSDKVIDLGGYQVGWDGTSMATPHVAGAAALYWSAYPTKTWAEVKAAILGSAKKIPAMSGKAVSEGKLDVKALLNFH